MNPDPFALSLRLTSELVSPGRALVFGVVQETHLNFHGTAHGGFIYTLADTAFALASNSHDIPAFALATHMEYLLPARAGDRLEANAEEVHVGGRTALYRVEVKRGPDLIALFTGTVYRVMKDQRGREQGQNAKESI